MTGEAGSAAGRAGKGADAEVILPAVTAEQIEWVRALFRDYALAVGACGCFQGFEREVAGLPGEYGPPAGRLWLAQSGLGPAGCVAMRRLEDGVAEMKRLYVDPEFRGRRLGRRLAEAVLAGAAASGYRAVRLDTLPSMTAARRLYEAMGFRVIPRYNDTPGDGVIHLERSVGTEG